MVAPDRRNGDQLAVTRLSPCAIDMVEADDDSAAQQRSLDADLQRLALARARGWSTALPGWRDRLFDIAVYLAAAILLFLLAVPALAKAPIVPRGQTFTCTPTLVWDGDGPIWCAEGPKVRLARINAREHDESCRRNAPCPAASGRAARDYLVQLLGGPRGITRTGHIRVAGPPLRCRSDGWGKGDRTAAWCSPFGGIDLSRQLVRSGVVVSSVASQRTGRSVKVDKR